MTSTIKIMDEGKGLLFQGGSKICTIVKTVISTWISFIFIPYLFIFKNSFWLQRNIMFLHFIYWPLRRDFNDTLSAGIRGVRNFYLTTTDNIRLGIWHVLPTSLLDKCDGTEESFEKLLKNGEPVVAYMHGNTGNRASYHRLELYKILQKLNCHVVALDYRSYGDSSDTLPDETGVVEDGRAMLKWIFKNCGNSPIYVWGHSMGTAVASQVVSILEKEGSVVHGLVLESPFNNLSDELRSHPFSIPFRHMLGFEYFFVSPMEKNGLSFRSDRHLEQCGIPILILHARDDWVVPVDLGRKLHVHLLKRGRHCTTKMVEFTTRNHYGHKYICRCARLANIISNFFDKKYDDLPEEMD